MNKKDLKKYLFKHSSQKGECKCHRGTCGGAFYGLGFVGAAIYFVSTATSFWTVVLGIFKAIVWPAMIVFGLLKFLGM
jgi:hypothetical protein